MSFSLFISSDEIRSDVDQIKPLVLLKDQGPVYGSSDEGNSFIKLLDVPKSYKTAATSSTGRVVVAAVGTNEPIHVYDGKSWLEPSLESYVAGGWRTVAVSSTAQYIAAVADNGQLYISNTQGSSWEQVPGLSGVDVAMSDDGRVLCCIEGGFGGYIRVSSDYGKTWTPTITSNGWETITMTGDGQVMVAAENSGYVYVSVNGGLNWNQRPLSAHWREITISRTGSTLIGVCTGTLPGRKILVSKNLGQTWEERGPEKQWASVMTVENGRKIVAVATNDYPYMSIDGGETWSPRTAFGKGNWTCVALSAVSEKQQFEEMDDPPTMMTTVVRIPTLETTRDSQNQKYFIYLEKYFLDCIWRDSEFPDEKLTANSGTSKSDKIFVTFYAGDVQQNIRLIEQNERSQTGVDCDVILHRDKDHIGEVSSFYEYTSKDVFDSNLWFENQHCNQSNRYAAPGLFIGKMNVQALLALRRVPFITVQMENNRTDKYKSPFWYRKFLTGVSLFNEDAGKYEVVENGTPSFQYFRQVGNITLKKADAGPYQPSSLYTFAQPLHEELFDGDLSSVFGVAPSANGSINLMSDEGVEVVLGQVALPSSATNANVLASYVIPGSTKLANGDFAPHPIYASSDMESYQVSTADGAGGWTSTSPSMSSAGFVETLPFPNGSWRGVALKAQNTAFSETTSAFPWERSLTAEQLMILDGKLSYNGSMHGTQVLSTEHYLYMPSGDFDEEVGERSLQIDLGKQSYVNKLQMMFPKSQERWQPTRLNATLQRTWPGTNADTYVDVYPSFWHQGFQGRDPYGENDGRVTKHIHTLSQRWPFNGREGEMMLGEHTGNLVSTYTFSGVDSTLPVTAYNLPVIVDGPQYKDAVTKEVEGVRTFSVSPNDVNPAFDFKRFEYGPFYQGATKSWLERLELNEALIGGVDAKFVKDHFPVAVCPRYRQPSWNTTESPNGFVFTNFHEWLYSSSVSERALGGLLQKWSPTGYNFRLSLPFWGAPDGMFEVTASSGNALAAFDSSDETYWEASGYSGNVWDSNVNNAGHINYVGSTSTVVNQADGSSFSALGEWLQIKLPQPVLLDGFILQPRQVPSVWATTSVSSSINGKIIGPFGELQSGTGVGSARLVVDSSYRRFTFTTSDGMYDKASPNQGNYIGPASPLPSQKNFVYLPGQTPDYEDGPLTPVSGEWFAVQFDRPKRIKGWSVDAANIQYAPSTFAVYCKNAGDVYWYSRGATNVSDWSRGPDITDDIVNGDPAGFTHWAVVVPRVQINYAIEAPGHIFAIYDTFLGKEIRANVEQKVYTDLADVARAVQNAINAEVGGQITYSVVWLTSSKQFSITNSGPLLAATGMQWTEYNFSILATDLATKLGFSGSFAQDISFDGSPNPPIIPTSQTRASFSITFHEAGEDDTSGTGSLSRQDQPTRVRIIGSNDGTSWTDLFINRRRWRSRGSDTTLDNSFVTDNVALTVQKRTAKYRYFRFVFSATQKSTTVGVSKLTLLAHDYDSPEYAATFVQSSNPVFNLDYLSPNERDDLYGNLYDWLSQKFLLYQIYGGEPLLDYIVKEEYYFAPNIDQEDGESVSDEFGTYRPNYKAVAQKMVKQRFAEGRYAGLAVGYESTNRGYYQGNVQMIDKSADPGNGRDHKCFSWRLCHQLYDFYSKGGEISDNDNNDAVKARFNKRFEMGMLTGVGLVDGGLGYISSKLGDNDVDLGTGQEVLVGNERVDAYAKANKVIGPDEVVGAVLYTSNVSANSVSTFSMDTVQLKGAGNVMSQTTASEKSPLYRKADFLLSFQSAR